MRNAGPDELQNEIKIGGGSTNYLRYVDDITLMEESEKILKSLLMRVKEDRERAGLRRNIKKTKNSDGGFQLHYCMTNRRGKCGNSDRYPFLSLQNHCRW